MTERENQDLQLKIEQYEDMLFKVSYIRLQNIHDAEDAVQEAFYQYIRRKENFVNEEHEKAWLLRVTLNACKKLKRSAWQKHRSAEEPDFLEEQADTESLTLEDGMLQKEESKELLKAVWNLPDKYREVIHLFYYENMSVKQIAGITGRKEATVTSQLSRGRMLLKKSLKEDYDFA